MEESVLQGAGTHTLRTYVDRQQAIVAEWVLPPLDNVKRSYNPHPLNVFRLLLSCHTERCLQTPVRNFHISPHPPHLGVPIAAHRLPVPVEPPCWHVHAEQITVRQRLLPLLDYRHLGSEVTKHEVFTKSYRSMCHSWEPWHRKSCLFKHLGEGNYVCGCTYPYLIDPPLMGDVDTMNHCRVGLKVGSHHRYAAHGVAHPRLLMLP